MTGTLINTAAIVAGSLIGSLLHRGIKEKYTTALFTAIGLSCLLLGSSTALKGMAQSHYPVLFILSLAIGAWIGTRLSLEEKSKKILSPQGNSSLIKGFITACLLFCIGTLSIVGPMMSALYGDNTFLITNATLDFTSSMLLAATYGIGIIWSAAVLLLWQGSIYLLTLLFGELLSASLMSEISIVGGALILSTGLSILGIKECKTLNLLPSLLVPPLFFLLHKLLLQAYHIIIVSLS